MSGSECQSITRIFIKIINRMTMIYCNGLATIIIGNVYYIYITLSGRIHNIDSQTKRCLVENLADYNVTIEVELR